tara:strand:+ start:411 stop:563 length:153 start_codon:yes stop_codon:yes gene_type:complete
VKSELKITKPIIKKIIIKSKNLREKILFFRVLIVSGLKRKKHIKKNIIEK